jgi:uncharacterized membrane protein
MILTVTWPLLTWGTVFRLRQYVKSSLWVWPLLGGAVGAFLGASRSPVDTSVRFDYWHYSPSTATTVLSAIIGSSAALTGFIVTVSVLVVQMATGTFSARYMRLWYRDHMLKLLLAITIGTLTYSFQLLRQIEATFVPDFGVTLAGMLIVLDLLLFLLFFDRFIHRLRPVAVAALVARAGRKAFLQSVRDTRATDAPTIVVGDYEPPGQPDVVVRSDRAGSIQAINGSALVRLAHGHGCVLVLPFAVGDFVPVNSTLVEAYGLRGGDRLHRRLRGMFALGDERTIEQDPAFAVRIMVDVAIRALSPAVNDPTTAVQVVDHLGDLLLVIGSTDLESRIGAAEHGAPGVVMPGRSWESFLALGVTEIREYGDRSIQVHRRLRAMLEELRTTVRDEHRPAVEEELRRLEQSVERSFGTSADLDRACVADRQGIGGAGV